MEGKIEIDKKPIDITNSLDKAICRLRSEKDSVILWVDQICINQQDQAEKEAQIKLMSLIYSRVLNTVIWLGDTSAQDAFDAIHDLEINSTSHYGPLLDERKRKSANLVSTRPSKNFSTVRGSSGRGLLKKHVCQMSRG